MFGRAPDFDTVIVNGGRVGVDLFTERLVADPRLSAVLLAISADHSSFEVVDRALSKLDHATTVTAVLTDAAKLDL